MSLAVIGSERLARWLVGRLQQWCWNCFPYLKNVCFQTKNELLTMNGIEIIHIHTISTVIESFMNIFQDCY